MTTLDHRHRWEDLRTDEDGTLIKYCTICGTERPVTLIKDKPQKPKDGPDV